MKKVAIIDHEDSFTYNLKTYLQRLGARTFIAGHRKITPEDIAAWGPTHMIFSPGPGCVKTPEDMGNSVAIFQHYARQIPILGVCLGHQMIAHYYGADIIPTPPAHGEKSLIHIRQTNPLFEGLSTPFSAMRYHSQIIDPDGFPVDKLAITARTVNGIIMAIKHRELPIYGTQFHPESIGTEQGMVMLKNFLNSEKSP